MSHGYQLLPHTADVILTAMAATREQCVAYAVEGLVACFADVSAACPDRTVTVRLVPDSDVDLLARVLEEVIFLADTAEVVPVAATVIHGAGRDVTVSLHVTPLGAVEIIGPAPKGVSRQGLRLEASDPGWRCAAIIDV